ncbi:MAG: 3-deoxy-D-manno-octulosonate 8-phosphate phosphatase [Planctomycetota bacterium]|nr:MAG: 3-deoxy-D-manno-octulosonate 8-phosphate phosphatase [Planctomycetota bacterium]
MIDEILKSKCKKIKMVITDIDGVLTDGGMYYSENGDELKKFNVRDGVGVILLKLAGLKVGAITGELTELVQRRIDKIKMDFVFRGVRDKLSCLKQCLKDYDITCEEVAYIGDEINDYCLFGNVGLFICPADANPVIKEKADLVLQSKGGEGVLREAAALLLKNQSKLMSAMDKYLSNN